MFQRVFKPPLARFRVSFLLPLLSSFSLYAAELRQRTPTPETSIPASLLKKFRILAAAPFIEGYTVHTKISQGSFGDVYLATRDEDGRKCAVKEYVRSDRLHSITETVQALTDISALPRHSNIVEILEILKPKDPRQHLMVVMNLLEGEELYDVIHDRDERKTKYGNFEDLEQKILIAGILSAIAHLHTHDILHRDLKEENFVAEKPGSTRFKLLDFDFATQDPNENFVAYQGTPEFISPEAIYASLWPNKERPDQSQVDNWAAGVILFEIITGSYPFLFILQTDMQQLSAWSKLYRGHKRQVFPFEISIPQISYLNAHPDIKNLLSGFLEKDPTKRLSINVALQNPWLHIPPYEPPADSIDLTISPYQPSTAIENFDFHLLKHSEIHIPVSLDMTVSQLMDAIMLTHHIRKSALILWINGVRTESWSSRKNRPLSTFLTSDQEQPVIQFAIRKIIKPPE